MAEAYKNESGLAAQLRAQYGIEGPIVVSPGQGMVTTNIGVFALENGKVVSEPMSFEDWKIYDRDKSALDTVQQFEDLGYDVSYDSKTGTYTWTNPFTGRVETTKAPFSSSGAGADNGGKPGWWEQALTHSGDTSPGSGSNYWYTNPDGSPGILTVDEEGNRGTYPGGTNPTSGGGGSGGGTTGGGGSGGGGAGGGGGYGPPTPSGGGWTPPTPGGGYNPRGPAGGSTSPFRPSSSFTGPAAGSIYGGTSVNGEYPTPPGLPGIPGNPFPIPPGQKAQEFKPYGEAVGEFSQMRSYGGLPRSTGPWGEMGGYYGGNPYGNTDPRLPPPPTLPTVPGYTPPNTTPTTLIGGHISTGDFYGTRPGEYRPGISVPGPNPSTGGTPPTGSGPPRDIPDEDEVFPHPGTNLPPPYDPGDGPITEPDIDFEYIPPGGTTPPPPNPPPPTTPPPVGGGGNKPGPQRPNSSPISMTSYGTGAPGSYEAVMAYLLANGVT